MEPRLIKQPQLLVHRHPRLCQLPRTMQKILSAGDHIRLCDTGGTFRNGIIAHSSGADGNPIVYEAAPGETPVIDLSMDVGAGGWNDLGGGVYQKNGYGRVLWEDGVPLHPATNPSCTDGNWFYNVGSGNFYNTNPQAAPRQTITSRLFGSVTAGVHTESIL